jgi:type IV secretory pathway VirB6-like protein
MIDRPTLAILIAIAPLFPASVTFAQTREAFGPV